MLTRIDKPISDESAYAHEGDSGALEAMALQRPHRTSKQFRELVLIEKDQGRVVGNRAVTGWMTCLGHGASVERVRTSEEKRAQLRERCTATNSEN